MTKDEIAEQRERHARGCLETCGEFSKFWRHGANCPVNARRLAKIAEAERESTAK